MKLWLISQTNNNWYDTYDSAVVAAETEEAARLTYPAGDKFWDGSTWVYTTVDGRIIGFRDTSWTSPSNVKAELLVDGYEGETGVILASFNAG